MPINAKLRNLRIAPRKVRLVVDLIRGKKVGEAQIILRFAVKKGAAPVLKLLNSAVANARHNFQLEPENLYIQRITVDEGPKYKRWMPRARGSASEIQKKTSHINLVLEEIKETPKTKKVKKGKAAVKKEQKPEIREEKEKKIEKPKIKPIAQTAAPKPKIVKGFNRIFRRKSM